MLEVFKEAAESMKLDEHDSQTLSKQVSPILSSNKSFLEYIVLLEGKGYVSINNFKKEE